MQEAFARIFNNRLLASLTEQAVIEYKGKGVLGISARNRLQEALALQGRQDGPNRPNEVSRRFEKARESEQE
jgi:hypothetical protein